MSHVQSEDPIRNASKRWLNQRAVDALRYPVPGSWLQPMGDTWINLASGYPFPNTVPGREFAAAMSHLVDIEGDRPFQYAGSPTSNDLTEWVADRMRKSRLMRQEDALLMTQGSIQGLDLLCRVTLDSESVVITQGPTYMEALEIFHNYTSHVVALPCDRPDRDFNEMLTTYLTSRTDTHPIKLLYLGSSFQNPTGLVMSWEMRQAMVTLAMQYNFLIVEDGAYDALYFGTPIPPIKTLDTRGFVVYLGTLSKTIAPGLRVGWATGPSPLLDAMARWKKDLGNPVISGITRQYLHSINYDARLDLLREQYRDRAHLAHEALTHFMPPDVLWDAPLGGFYIWLRYPDRIESTDLLDKARSLGVSYVPGQYFYPFAAAPHTPKLRICFSYETPPRMEEGIRRLARAFEQTLGTPHL